MCLDNISERKIAQKPIIVFKSGFPQGEDFASRYEGHLYKKGPAKPIEDFNPVGVLYPRIEPGYHSYRSWWKCRIHKHESTKVGIFVIPKGAAYYEGENHDETPGYASDSIEFLGFFSIPSYLKALWNTMK